MSRRIEQPLSLMDIIRAAVKYRWRALATFLLLLSLAIVAVVLFPKKYESEAKLFVRLGRGSVTMDTVATTGPTVSLQESRETEMNSVVDMLESRQLREAVVKKVGADRILKKYALVEQWMDQLSDSIPKLSSSVTPDAEMTEEEVEAQEEFELAVKYLTSNVKIKSPKKSTTVTVTCRARTANLAKEIATEFVTEYQRMHLSAYQEAGSFKFFEENFKQHDDLVKAYEDEMRSAKNEMSLITIGGKQGSLQQQMTDVQKDIASAEAELASAKASLGDLVSDMGNLPEKVPTEVVSGIANAATDTMRSRLYDLEIREKELATKYKSNHPVLKKLQQQLAESRQVLSEQEPEREQNTMAPNPVRQDTHVLLLQEKARVAGLEAKVASLKTIENDLVASAKQVNQFEVRSAELQRKINLANNNHLIYAKKLEESRINSALDSEAISNVSIIQPPTFMLKHVSPKRSVLGLLGVLFSGLGALFVAVVSDRMNKDSELDDRDLLLIQAKERLLRMEASERESRLAEQMAEEAKQEVVAATADPQLPR